MNQVSEKIRVWGDFNTIEPQAMNQIYNVSKLEVVDGVAIMPDCHFGKGATVGSVIASRGAVLPAAVGVDIGCGMAALKTNLRANDLPDDLAAIRSTIESYVPHGFDAHKGSRDVFKERNDNLRAEVEKHIDAYNGLACIKHLNPQAAIIKQIGTLGGGNHFIEVCLDENQQVWVMLHSGSRNVGKVIAEVHISKAKDMLSMRGVQLPDRDLAWFDHGTPEFDGYVHDVSWAQEYARLNRAVMINNVFAALKSYFPGIQVQDQAIHCHHNYVSKETFGGLEYYITRKGAVNASTGTLGIIPGSMGTRSYIVRGLGNEDSFNSCSHGAGRRMSRSQAKKTFTLADLETQTQGVECRKDQGVLDEIPGSYKDIDIVMENQKDLVETVAILKACLCVKG